MRILILLLFVLTSAAKADTVNEWVDRFVSYQKEYDKVFKLCVPRSKSAALFLDIADCMWRKDKILMKRYRVDEALYKVSYERYRQTFNVAKTATVERRGVDYFLETMIDIQADTEELQEYTFAEYLVSIKN